MAYRLSNLANGKDAVAIRECSPLEHEPSGEMTLARACTSINNDVAIPVLNYRKESFVYLQC